MFDKICTAPWRHLFVSPDGNVKTCCIGKDVLGNIHKNNIDEITQNDKIKSIRNSILKKDIPNNCLDCKKLYDTGIAGEKENFTNDIWISEIIELPEKFIPKSLDIRWNNTCNLSCVYCFPIWSSNWNIIEKSNYNILESEKKELFKKYIKNNSKEIQKIMLLGGEPLLIKDNIELLEIIDDNVEIYVISNLSIPNLEKSKIYSLLKNRKVIWGISFENIKEKFEYVRNGASWDIFDNNIKLLKSNANFAVNAQSVYNIFSAFDIDKFYNYCLENELPITWSNLITPRELDVTYLPIKYKQMAIENLENLIKKSHNSYKFDFKTLHSNILKSKNTINNIDELKKFIEIKENKLKKQISFFDLWIEFK